MGERMADGITDASPHYDQDGQRAGITINEVSPNSLVAMLGIQAGDIVVEMAGLSCTSVRRCRIGTRRVEAAVWQRRGFSIIVRRAGRLVRLAYRYHRPRPLASVRP